MWSYQMMVKSSICEFFGHFEIKSEALIEKSQIIDFPHMFYVVNNSLKPIWVKTQKA